MNVKNTHSLLIWVPLHSCLSVSLNCTNPRVSLKTGEDPMLRNFEEGSSISIGGIAKDITKGWELVYTYAHLL